MAPVCFRAIVLLPIGSSSGLLGRSVTRVSQLFSHAVELAPNAFDGEGAEYRVLLTNFSDFVVVGPIAPRHYLFGPIPDLDNNSLRRMSFKRNNIKACGKNFAACLLDARLSPWGIF